MTDWPWESTGFSGDHLRQDMTRAMSFPHFFGPCPLAPWLQRLQNISVRPRRKFGVAANPPRQRYASKKRARNILKPYKSWDFLAYQLVITGFPKHCRNFWPAEGQHQEAQGQEPQLGPRHARHQQLGLGFSGFSGDDFYDLWIFYDTQFNLCGSKIKLFMIFMWIKDQNDVVVIFALMMLSDILYSL